MAVDARTRKCVHRASSRPPPRARDEMAEMVGMGRWERAVNVVRRVRRNAWVLGGWGWGLVLVCFSGVVMGWCGMVWNGVMVIYRMEMGMEG